jgi:hypothetical protein
MINNKYLSAFPSFQSGAYGKCFYVAFAVGATLQFKIVQPESILPSIM